MQQTFFSLTCTVWHTNRQLENGRSIVILICDFPFTCQILLLEDSISICLVFQGFKGHLAFVDDNRINEKTYTYTTWSLPLGCVHLALFTTCRLLRSLALVRQSMRWRQTMTAWCPFSLDQQSQTLTAKSCTRSFTWPKRVKSLLRENSSTTILLL